MTTTEVTFTARDGLPLAGTLYEPENVDAPAGGTTCVLVNSATGAPRGYYERFALFLAERGFVVLTYDYRGLFDSAQGSALDDLRTMRDWGELDTEAAIDYLLQRKDCKRVALVGHSIGGTLLGLAKNNDKVACAVAMASPSGHWRHWPFPAKLFPFFGYTIAVPIVVSLLGKLPAFVLGTELPRGIALEWARWCSHEAFVVDESGCALHDGFAKYKGSLLFYSTVDDIYAPPDAVRALSNLFVSAKRELRVVYARDWGVPRIGHFGFFRKTAPASFWQILFDFLKEP